jgi:hypothetical protein
MRCERKPCFLDDQRECEIEWLVDVRCDRRAKNIWNIGRVDNALFRDERNLSRKSCVPTIYRPGKESVNHTP